MNESKDFKTKIKRIEEFVDSEQNSSNMQEELTTQTYNLKKTMKIIKHLASA